MVIWDLVNLCQFDQINRMVTLSVITLRSFRCNTHPNPNLLVSKEHPSLLLWDHVRYIWSNKTNRKRWRIQASSHFRRARKSRWFRSPVLPKLFEEFLLLEGFRISQRFRKILRKIFELSVGIQPVKWRLVSSFKLSLESQILNKLRYFFKEISWMKLEWNMFYLITVQKT